MRRSDLKMRENTTERSELKYVCVCVKVKILRHSQIRKQEEQGNRHYELILLVTGRDIIVED